MINIEQLKLGDSVLIKHKSLRNDRTLESTGFVTGLHITTDEDFCEVCLNTSKKPNILEQMFKTTRVKLGKTISHKRLI